MSELAPGRYTIARRATQVAVLLLLAGGHRWRWPVLAGDLSFSRVLGTVPLADPLAALQLGLAHGPPARDVLLGAAIVLLFYGLLAGRAFCAWVCPVNMVTDLVNRWRGPRLATAGPGRAVRYGVLALALGLSALLGAAAFEAVSPIGAFHRAVVYGAAAAWLAVLAVAAYDLGVQRNGFCGRLCPLGAFYALTTRFRALRVVHDHAACSGCGHCFRVCPEPSVLRDVGKVSGTLDDPHCTNCGRCLEVCPDTALRFGWRRSPRHSLPGGS